ncbi:MAG: type secretion system protein ImpE [Blastocatellia bacterium]|nr:type secretion system protein ImpE [Blastocatellia bacterium]
MADEAAAKAKTLFDAGQLSEAIAALTQAVKGNPGDTRLRTFLFELLCFAGDWERAGRQLDVIGHQGTSAEVGVQVYHNCIKAEIDRRHLITDCLAPHFIKEPPQYVDMHLEAINQLRLGDTQGLTRTLQQAEEERPALSGTRGDQIFQDFRDLDDLFGPVLELIVQNKYTWLPLEQVVELTVDTPTQLRDLIWSPVNIQMVDKDLRAFIPNIYVNSYLNTDDRIKLGRMTDWEQIADDCYKGVGLRVFAIDDAEQGVHELKKLTFDQHDAGAAAQVM